MVNLSLDRRREAKGIKRTGKWFPSTVPIGGFVVIKCPSTLSGHRAGFGGGVVMSAVISAGA
jgi:hypothetical protein